VPTTRLAIVAAMASNAKKPAKRRVQPGTSGRVTPKGGHGTSGGGAGRTAPAASSRYTPPVPKEMKISPWWIPALVLGLLALGTLIIILNYVELLPTWGFLPDGTSNMWLLTGLVMILAGVMTATQWH
jgi:hypothetical protein